MTDSVFPAVRGLLFDLDGVLYVGTGPVPGALEALLAVRAAGLPCRFLTNTSTLTLASLHRKLAGLGFDIPPDQIISAPQAALRWLHAQGNPPCHLVLADDVRQDFSDVPQTDIESAEVLVVGDIGEAWNHALLNRLFNRLMQGARLVAIHRNKFWQTEAGLAMDIGAYVAALEYCSGVQAVVTGKPSPDFFRIAVADMGLKPEETALVGDDIDTDIGGAQACGIHGILVRTGKYRDYYVAVSSVKPERVIESVAALPRLLGIER